MPSDTSDYSIRNIFNHPDRCYNDSFLFVSSQFSTSDVYFGFYKTGECVQWLEEKNFSSENLPNCSPGLIDLEVSPVYNTKSSVSYPYSTMNISITSHSKISSVSFRLECLYAESGEDVYCSNHRTMYHNGKREWPCRALGIYEDNADKVAYPMRFSYACFMITPHSIYRINATVSPQNCQASLTMTSPTLEQLFPEELNDPKKLSKSSDSLWSPMVIVDISEDDGVWLKIGKSNRAKCDQIQMDIFRQEDDKFNYILTHTVDCPETGIKWENVKKGRYFVDVYISGINCEYTCKKVIGPCQVCPRTRLKFTINEDRISLKWKTIDFLKDSSGLILIILIGVMVACIVCSGGFAYYLYRKDRERNENPTEIELQDRVKVLMIYAYDCEEHEKCVASFVDCLRRNANAHVFFNYDMIFIPGAMPSKWLVQSFCDASKHLIYISQCGNLILDEEAMKTHHLRQVMPYPDMFEPSLNMVMRECTTSPSTALKRFAIVRMSYSPPIPRVLEVLGLQSFIIPEQFPQLTAFLHDIDTTEVRYKFRQNLRKELADDLKERCLTMEKMQVENPTWIDRLWVKREEEREIHVPLTIRSIGLKTDKDMKETSERLNLLPPDIDYNKPQTSKQMEIKKKKEVKIRPTTDTMSVQKDQSTTENVPIEQLQSTSKNVPVQEAESTKEHVSVQKPYPSREENVQDEESQPFALYGMSDSEEEEED